MGSQSVLNPGTFRPGKIRTCFGQTDCYSFLGQQVPKVLTPYAQKKTFGLDQRVLLRSWPHLRSLVRPIVSGSDSATEEVHFSRFLQSVCAPIVCTSSVMVIASCLVYLTALGRTRSWQGKRDVNSNLKSLHLLHLASTARDGCPCDSIRPGKYRCLTSQETCAGTTSVYHRITATACHQNGKFRLGSVPRSWLNTSCRHFAQGRSHYHPQIRCHQCYL